MSNGNGNGNGKSFWLTALQTVGFPVVACAAVTWFAYTTIQWEREQMLPAIQSNTEVLRDVQKVLLHAERNL